jgi:hypothetical protein
MVATPALGTLLPVMAGKGSDLFGRGKEFIFRQLEDGAPD